MRDADKEMAQRVAVWWLAVDAVAEAEWPALAALLDDDERARAARFHFERDRHSYVAAHALGRRLLSSWAGGAPQDWRFSVGEHGKPEVVVAEGAPRLRLNLSHTRGLAAAALTVGGDIGIDVEWLDRKAASPDLAQRFFAPAECDQLARVAPEQAGEAFLTFWTLKESYVKAIGKGLAHALDRFAFTLDPLAIHFDPVPGDDPADWLFHRFRPTPRHLMALAFRRTGAGQPEIEVEAPTVAELIGSG